MSKSQVWALAAVLLSSQGVAQQQLMVVGAQAAAVLRAGTPLRLETMNEITTEGKGLHVGDRVQLQVSEPVSLNGQIVIPVGSHAVGEITSVRNKGMWGKSGGITARVLYVEANGRQLRVSGAFDDKGKTGTGGVIAAVAFIPVAGFFVTGTSAKIALGARVNAYLDEDMPVQFADAQPAPMIVSTPTNTSATQALTPAATQVGAPTSIAKVTPVSMKTPD